MTTKTVKAAIEYLVDQKEISRTLLHYPDAIAVLITFLENEEAVYKKNQLKVTKDS